jgi:hypothetical protein
MQSNTIRQRRVARTLNEIICLLKSVAKIRIVVHIPESIGISEKGKSWRWWLFVRIEIPVVIVDIIFSEVKNISFVEGKRNNRTWKSSICTDFIAILIEYYIPYRLFVSEKTQKLRLMFE